MRNIVLARVDDRLIHGEVVTAWTPSLSANRIVIVDDTVAADKFNKRVLMALAPQGTKVAVLSVEGATKALQKPDPGNERVIVLTKTPIVFEQLLDGGVEIKEVCLGVWVSEETASRSSTMFLRVRMRWIPFAA